MYHPIQTSKPKPPVIHIVNNDNVLSLVESINQPFEYKFHASDLYLSEAVGTLVIWSESRRYTTSDRSASQTSTNVGGINLAGSMV